MTHEKRLKELTERMTKKEFLFAVYGTHDEEGTVFLKGNMTEIAENIYRAMDKAPELANLVLAVAKTFKKYHEKSHHD